LPLFLLVILSLLMILSGKTPDRSPDQEHDQDHEQELTRPPTSLR
jgi:hypothetical protein